MNQNDVYRFAGVPRKTPDYTTNGGDRLRCQEHRQNIIRTFHNGSDLCYDIQPEDTVVKDAEAEE